MTPEQMEQRITELEAALRAFLDSPIEFDGHRNYSVRQVDRDDIEVAELLLISQQTDNLQGE